MNINQAQRDYEARTFSRYSRELEEMDDESDPEEVALRREENDERRPARRHPGDFEDYPSNEQKEYFKQGMR